MLSAGSRWVPAIVLVVVLVVFLAIFRRDIQAESERTDLARVEALDQIEGSLTSEIRHQVDLHLSISAFFAASIEVDRQDYAQFVAISDKVDRNPELLAVGWAPLLRPAELAGFENSARNDPIIGPQIDPSFEVVETPRSAWYIVVEYIEPFAGNTSLLGLDLESSAAHLEAMQRARAGNSVVATEPITSDRGSGVTTEMWLMSPIFDGSASDERDGFLGVTFTIFDVERLIADSPVDLASFVVSDRGRAALERQPEASFIFESGGSTEPSSIVRSMEVAGRQWEVALGEGVIEPRSNASIFVGLLPLLIGVLSLAAVVWMFSRNSLISERRAIELTSEVRQKNRELMRSNDWLESFTRVASHDLRSPLRAVTSLVSFIREDNPELAESAAFNLSRIEQRINRMNSLIDDLLTLARISDASEKPTEVRFQGVIDEVLATIDVPAGFTVTTELSGEESGRLAAVQFETCIRNLVDNAIKHHDEESGLVTITTAATADEVEVVVTDDGPGIPPQYLESVFEPFRRLKPDDESPGSGIGLTAILRTTENNGGSISVESDEGVGTTFRLRWPLGEYQF